MLLAQHTTLDEETVHGLLVVAMLGVGAVVYLTEKAANVAATYGRFAHLPLAKSCGPAIPAKLAWLYQESPAALVPLALLAAPAAAEPRCLASWPNRALLAMFLSHYLYRAFVYPFRIRGGKPMPIGISSLAALFCLVNGPLQGRLWTALHVRSIDSAADAALFAVGCAVWLAGWRINLDSDAILRNLRQPGESGYKIPRGGMFTYVSAANYFGETVEWLGYAIASRHLAAWAFAIFTFCNTAPRAHQYHAWYRAKFGPDYPPERTAFIPWLW